MPGKEVQQRGTVDRELQMVSEVFRVKQDGRYDYLRIAPHDYEDWKARMTPLEQAVRGVPLRDKWDDGWDFVVLEEDDFAEHPEGVGDFAEMNRLIAATNERGFELLKHLLGEAAEVLTGTFEGRPVWFFNVTRRVERSSIGRLEEDAVFRINPVGLDILCGSAFKNAVEASGLKGLTFRKVDPDDPRGMV
jgi:hypothetical protein